MIMGEINKDKNPFMENSSEGSNHINQEGAKNEEPIHI